MMNYSNYIAIIIEYIQHKELIKYLCIIMSQLQATISYMGRACTSLKGIWDALILYLH